MQHLSIGHYFKLSLILNESTRDKTMPEIGFEPTPTTLDCYPNATPKTTRPS